MQNKILLLNWRDIHNPEAGGAEVYYHEIFKRIVGQGKYSVTVLSHAFDKGLSDETIDGIRVLRQGGKFLFNFHAMRYVRKQAGAYDLIIEDLNKVPFFTRFFTSKPRMHMVMHFFGKAIFKEAPLPLALYIYLMEKLVPLFYKQDPFSVISQSTADEVAVFCKHKLPVKVVEPGVNLDFFKPECPKTIPPYLLYIGRVKKYKNVQFILRCLKTLKEQIPELELVVAGSGDYTEPLKNLAQSLGLKSAVRFTGYVSEEEKRRLLSGATLVINPSAKEGWGITNIEANACGTVSVSSRVAGLKDSVRDTETGLLFTYGDEADFVQKTLGLLKDPALRNRMEANALRFAQRFDWDRLALEMSSFLDQII